MKNKFYMFSQNNSGGTFAVDDRLCHRVVIQALTEEEAVSKAEDLGCYWDGCDNGIDCNCCGDRWYKSPEEVKLPMKKSTYHSQIKTVKEYCQYLADSYGWTTPDSRIFYKSGKVVEIFKPVV